MTSILNRLDALADEEAPIHRLNISGKRVYRSTLGGFCTLMIFVIFILLLWTESKEVINKEYPFVQSKPVKDMMQYEVSYNKELPVFNINIRDAAKYYKLDKTKIDVYAQLNKVIKTFPNGTKIYGNQRFEIKECTT